MKTSLVIFSCFCALILLVSLVPPSEAGMKEIKKFMKLMEDKKLHKKIKKILPYIRPKKVYAIPFPFPIPIPILKKVTPIIYKDTKAVPYPVPYPMQMGGGEGYEKKGGEGGYGASSYMHRNYALPEYDY